MTEHHAVPDRATDAQLPNGAAVAFCIDNDGERWPWLLVPNGNGQTPGCLCAVCCSHERTGPLPLHMQTRVDRATRPRCGRPTLTGAPCRIEVKRHGQVCHLHQPKAAPS